MGAENSAPWQHLVTHPCDQCDELQGPYVWHTHEDVTWTRWLLSFPKTWWANLGHQIQRWFPD